MANAPITIDPLTGQLMYVAPGTQVPVPINAPLPQRQAPSLAPPPTGLPPMFGQNTPQGTGFVMPNSFWPPQQPYATEGVQAPQLAPLGPEAGTRIPPAQMPQAGAPSPTPQTAPPPQAAPAQQPLPSLGETPMWPQPPQPPLSVGGPATQQAQPQPQTPEETAAAADAWDGFMQQLMSPGLNSMLLQLGTQLMQPVPVGQSPLGHVGMGIQKTMQGQLGLQAFQGREKRADTATKQAERRTDIAQGQLDLGKEQAATQKEQFGETMGLKREQVAAGAAASAAEAQRENRRIGLEGKRVELEGQRVEIAKSEAEQKAQSQRIIDNLNKAKIESEKAKTEKTQAEAESERKGVGASSGTTAAKVQEYRYLASALVETGQFKTEAEAVVWLQQDRPSEEEIYRGLIKGADPWMTPEERAAFDATAQETAHNVIKNRIRSDIYAKGYTEKDIAERARNLHMDPDEYIESLTRTARAR